MRDLVKLFEEWRKTTLLPAITTHPEWQKAKATGNAQAFLESAESYTATDVGFIQYGVPYSKAIDSGRGKTVNMVRDPQRYQSILTWVGLKKYGITFKDAKEQAGIAFAIMRKQDKEGSYKFRNETARTKIYEDALAKALPDLNVALNWQYMSQLNSDVAETIKAFFSKP